MVATTSYRSTTASVRYPFCHSRGPSPTLRTPLSSAARSTPEILRPGVETTRATGTGTVPVVGIDEQRRTPLTPDSRLRHDEGPAIAPTVTGSRRSPALHG